MQTRTRKQTPYEAKPFLTEAHEFLWPLLKYQVRVVPFMVAWREVARVVGAEVVRLGLGLLADSNKLVRGDPCGSKVGLLEQELGLCGRTRELLESCEEHRITLIRSLDALRSQHSILFFFVGAAFGSLFTLSICLFFLGRRGETVGKGEPVDLTVAPILSFGEEKPPKEDGQRDSVAAARRRARALRG